MKLFLSIRENKRNNNFSSSQQWGIPFHFKSKKSWIPFILLLPDGGGKNLVNQTHTWRFHELDFPCAKHIEKQVGVEPAWLLMAIPAKWPLQVVFNKVSKPTWSTETQSTFSGSSDSAIYYMLSMCRMRCYAHIYLHSKISLKDSCLRSSALVPTPLSFWILAPLLPLPKTLDDLLTNKVFFSLEQYSVFVPKEFLQWWKCSVWYCPKW